MYSSTAPITNCCMRFGLSNHDQHNPWTTLNQKRMVGYLTVYDRSLLTLLYDPRIKPGMTMRQARAVLPGVNRRTWACLLKSRQISQFR